MLCQDEQNVLGCPSIPNQRGARHQKPSSNTGRSSSTQYGSTDSIYNDASGTGLEASTRPSPNNLLSNSSGSDDGECDDSAYLASGNADDGSAYSAHCSSSGSAIEGGRCVEVQAERMPDEWTGRRRQTLLNLTKITGELERMHCERHRELEFLSRMRMLDEVNGEVGKPRSPSPARVLAVQDAPLARPGGARPVWAPALQDAGEARQAKDTRAKGRDQAHAGPAPAHRGTSAQARAGRREELPQPRARTPSGQRLAPSRAGAPSQTAPPELPSTASAAIPQATQHFGDNQAATQPMQKRKRTLRPLPRSARTLIVRNVPWAYTQEDLLHFWPPDGTYDYFHTPYHFFNDRPLGHAYINFNTYEAAVAFQDRWHGRYLSWRDTKNTLDITFSHDQGRGPNLARIAKDKIPILVEKNYVPVLMDGTRRLGPDEALAELIRSCSPSDNGPREKRFQ